MKKLFTHIALFSLLFSCNSQRETSFFKNEKGEFVDILFYKQSVVPGLQETQPYVQYTIELSPAVSGEFEIRDEADKTLEIKHIENSDNQKFSTIISFSDRNQSFDENKLVLVWFAKNDSEFVKLGRPIVKEALVMP